MSSYMTSTTLIESIKRRAQLPTSQNTFTNEDFLAFANEELMAGLLPSILQLHEEYLLQSDTVPLVAQTTVYKIPYRAIGNKLREISYQDTNGNIYEMTRITIESLSAYRGPYTDGYSRVFYVQNNSVVLVPTITGSVTGSLIMSYFMRPNQIVTEDRVATIVDINTTTGDITVDSVPDNFTINSLYDFIEVKSPHTLLAFDKPILSINSTTNVINVDPANIPSDLAIGDHLAQAGECIIPMIPDELHVILAHRVAARCLEALGDTQGLQNANAKLEEFESKTGNLIDNRVEGAPLKVTNRSGPLRQGLVRRRFRRFF